MDLQLDLLLGILYRVGSVTDVATDSQSEVTTDGAWIPFRQLYLPLWAKRF